MTERAAYEERLRLFSEALQPTYLVEPETISRMFPYSSLYVKPQTDSLLSLLAVNIDYEQPPHCQIEETKSFLERVEAPLRRVEWLAELTKRFPASTMLRNNPGSAMWRAAELKGSCEYYYYILGDEWSISVAANDEDSRFIVLTMFSPPPPDAGVPYELGPVQTLVLEPDGSSRVWSGGSRWDTDLPGRSEDDTRVPFCNTSLNERAIPSR